MPLLQKHLNLVDSVRFGLCTTTRFAGVSLAILAMCAGASYGQWQAVGDDSPNRPAWQASPRSSQSQTARSLQWQGISSRPAARGVAYRSTQNRHGQDSAYDAKVVQTSGDASYMLDPVAEEQINTSEGEPMVIHHGGMSDPRMYGAYADPSMSHPWQGGEYWFDPRCGLPPFMCRYPLWMEFARGRLWFRGEYLLWWMRGSDTPALVTTGPLGSESTTILSGAEKMNADAQSGGRLSLGWWFDDSQCFGMEIDYLGVGKSQETFHADTDSTPTIVRPFTDAVSGAQAVAQVGYPAILDGSIDVDSTAEFQSFEFLFRRAMIQRCDYRVDILFGYRYGRLQDRLVVEDHSEVIGQEGPAPVGTINDAHDRFETLNKFNGAELGIAFNRRNGRWAYEMLMKLALGRTSSRVDIDGATTITSSTGSSSVYAGDMLALPSNIGTYKAKEFAVMPEVGLNLMYSLTPRTTFTFGYSLIYLSHVARPGDQIDTTINTTQALSSTLSGVALPEFQMRTSDFWAHGLNFGFDFRF